MSFKVKNRSIFFTDFLDLKLKSRLFFLIKLLKKSSSRGYGKCGKLSKSFSSNCGKISYFSTIAALSTAFSSLF